MIRSSVIVLLLIDTVIIGGVDAGLMSSSRVVKAAPCGDNEFRCDNGTCIPDTNHCNDNKDCADGSDEVGCDYFLCMKPMWYRCKHDNSCINSAFLCDNHDDCPLGDDEENCENFEVPHIPVPCNKFEFTCTDKMCIPVDLVCDGVANCLDGSDETIGCLDVEKKCKGFLCKNKHCIESGDLVCNGIDDCEDGSDEEHCLAGCDLKHGKVKCDDHSSCIDLRQVCDGKDDCRDRSDEGQWCQSKESSSLRFPKGFKIAPNGAGCLCEVGYTFNEKSNACEDINECEVHGLCSQGCENTPGSFRCTCVDKFKLKDDGRTCELDDFDEPLLLYTTQESIGGLYLNTKHQYYVAKDLSLAIGVSCDGSHVYWTDITDKMESIERSLEDGSKRELLLTSGLASPEDLELDWLTGNIYFSDSGHMMIAVCSNNGVHCSILIKDTLQKPRGIALLPQNGTLFYSDWGDKPVIGTVNMDGSNNRILIERDIHWPNGLSMDWPNERLYWVDAKLKKIESIKLDGTNRVTVLDDDLKHPFSISVFNDRVYWSDWDTKSIHSCEKFNGKDRKIELHDRQIFDIHIYHPALQPKGDHPCLGNFCSHLCLLASNDSYTCACPQGMSLKVDKHSCHEKIKRQYLLLGISNHLVKLETQSFGRHETSKADAFQIFFHRMAFNTITGEIFVADNRQKAIFTVDLKTKASKRLITTGIANISALAFDVLGNNLYWADTERSTIEVFSLQTRQRAIIHHYLGTEKPVGLAVVSEIGKIFIALRSSSPTPHTHIVRQDMTGRGPHLNITEERLSGNGTFNFVVDRDLHVVYWNDMGLSKIEFTTYKGDKRHLFQESLQSPVSTAIAGDSLFWTCFRSKHLYWSDKHNPGVTKKITIDIPPYRALPDEIILLGSQPLQRHDHPCQKQNGGCSHICVPAGMNSTACICPTGMIFSSPKNTTCIDAIDCEFKCTSGECLKISKQCNGNKDCADGSDEKGCDEKNCRFDRFMCADKSKCIDQKMRCDKHFDCEDHSDEKNCERYGRGIRCHENQHACPDGNCIDVDTLCDGFPDCSDGSDEAECTDLNNEKKNTMACGPQYFRCNTGQCIPRWWECDGSPDCSDGSDEHEKCGKGYVRGIGCHENQHACPDGMCIDEHTLCDGFPDCLDASDEVGCTDLNNEKKNVTACGLQMFRCNTGQCIPKWWECDGSPDCSDGSDEHEKCLQKN